jgi:RNA 3'-terminal phosphate cyclase (ATP)
MEEGLKGNKNEFTTMGGIVTIDGSQGEGGGQVLRSSLALSLVTGRPLAMEKIRAGRKKPGLLRQHLTAVLAAAEVSGAAVEGAALDSRRLVFRPGPVR